jgi:hypothetical protein
VVALSLVAHIIGNHLRMEFARVEALLADVGQLIRDARPAELSPCDAMPTRVESEFYALSVPCHTGKE